MRTTGCCRLEVFHIDWIDWKPNCSWPHGLFSCSEGHFALIPLHSVGQVCEKKSSFLRCAERRVNYWDLRPSSNVVVVGSRKEGRWGRKRNEMAKASETCDTFENFRSWTKKCKKKTASYI